MNIGPESDGSNLHSVNSNTVGQKNAVRKTIMEREDNDITFLIEVPGELDAKQVFWSRNNQRSLSSDRFKPYYTRNKSSLAIRQLTLEDAGNYYAECGDSYGTTRLASVDLNVEKRIPRVPIFLKRLHDVSVKIGSRARLLVEIDSVQPLKVTWYHDNQILKMNDRLNFLEENKYYCLDVGWTMLQDEGHWTCIAENKHGCSVSSACLTILVPKAYKAPQFDEELKTILAEDGTVSLECKVTGVPTPTLLWYKDGKKIKAGDTFALRVDSSKSSSLGTYSCVAKNCLGQAFSSSSINFQKENQDSNSSSIFPLGPQPKFLRELQNVEAQIESQLTLTCQVVVPPWPKTIDWYNKSGRIVDADRYKTVADGLGMYGLQIKSVEMVDDGEWKCVATSFFGIKAFSSCYVTVKFPKNYKTPKFLENLRAVMTPEGLVSFECKVIGYPTPHLSWLKDGKELKPGDVYQLTGTNSLGTYCCIAKNPMGEISSTTVLTLEDIQSQLTKEERLMIFATNQPPYFVNGLFSHEAKINEEFQFNVQVSGKPDPKIFWYRNDEPVEENERISINKESHGNYWLRLKYLEMSDQTDWKCVAVNDYGQSVTSCFVKLIIPKRYKSPRFLEKLKASVTKEGTVNLECKVIGVPQPQLRWFKDGRQLKSGEMHKIISGVDGKCCLGTYSCEAVNCMGIAYSSASLLAFENENENVKKNLNLPESLSIIMEERSSQLNNSTLISDKSTTYEEAAGISFSFDGKEVSISLYETPDLTEEEALQIVEMYANELTDHITEQNIVELPSLRFVKETSTTGNILMEATVIDVPINDYGCEEELKTEADVENSMMDDSAFVTNNSPNSEDISVDKNYSDFSHNILQTSQSYLEDLSSDRGSELKFLQEKLSVTKNRGTEAKAAVCETGVKKSLTSAISSVQKCKSVNSEDDSLHEFERQKSRKIREKSENSTYCTVEKEKLETPNAGIEVNDSTLKEKIGNLSVLESIAQSINTIEQDLDQIRIDVIAEVAEEKSLGYTVTIVDSLLQPVGEIKKYLAFIGEQLSTEGDKSQKITTEEILQSLSKPVVEFQHSLLDIGYTIARDKDELFARTGQSILDAVTPSLKEINKELNLIEEEVIQCSQAQSQVEKFENQLDAINSDSQKMIVILTQYSKELEDLSALILRRISSAKLKQTSHNVFENVNSALGQMISVQCWSLNLHKCVEMDAEQYSSFQNDLQEFNCCLIHYLDTNIHVIQTMLQTSIDSALLHKFLSQTIPHQEKLTTSLRVVENLSPVVAANYLCEALRNYTSSITEIFTQNETQQSNPVAMNFESIKSMNDSINVILNTLDTTEKCSIEENSYHKKRLMLSLAKLQMPLQLCQTQLFGIEKQLSGKNPKLNGVEVYNMMRNVSEPLQILRKEISILVGNYQRNQRNLPQDVNKITELLIPALTTMQESITTFLDIIFNQQTEEIDEIYILLALNNFNKPLCELSNRFLKVENLILEQTSIVSDPKLGICTVMLSVSSLVDVIADLQADSTKSHSTSLVLCNLSEPLVEVKICLQEINDRFNDVNLENINITMLRTLSEPFNLLQKRLIEATDIVTDDLKHAVTDLQRTILTIQDQVSFEYGDQPASIEYNIMTLQMLIRPMNVLRNHFLVLQTDNRVENIPNFGQVIEHLKEEQFKTIDKIKTVLIQMLARHKYLQSQLCLSKSIHSMCNLLNGYKNLILLIENAVSKNELTNEPICHDTKTILHQLYSDFNEVEKSSHVFGDILLQLQVVVKILRSIEEKHSSDKLSFQGEVQSLTFLTPVFKELSSIVDLLAESDFQEDDSVKCFIALLQSLNTIRTLEENVKNFQSSSNTDSIQVPMLQSFLNSCERLEIKISDLLFIIENFADRKTILDPQFYQRAIDAFSTLNSQLTHLNKCLIDQSMSDDDNKEIPFESSISLFNTLYATVTTDSPNQSVKQIQLIIKEGILNELARLKSDILFNMSLIQTDDEISFNDSDMLEENFSSANPDLLGVCVRSVWDEVKKCDKYFDRMNTSKFEQKLKYLNNVSNSLESIFNIINFVKRNIPFENSPEHVTMMALHMPVLHMLQQIRQIRTALETHENDILLGSRVDADGSRILILMNDLDHSFQQLKQLVMPLTGAAGYSRMSSNMTESKDEPESEDLIGSFGSDLSSSTETVSLITKKEKLEVNESDIRNWSLDQFTFSESSSPTSDVFVENKIHQVTFENSNDTIIDAGGKCVSLNLQDSISSENNEESDQEIVFSKKNKFSTGLSSFLLTGVTVSESADNIIETRDFCESKSKENIIEVNETDKTLSDNLAKFEELQEKPLNQENNFHVISAIGQEIKSTNELSVATEDNVREITINKLVAEVEGLKKVEEQSNITSLPIDVSGELSENSEYDITMKENEDIKVKEETEAQTTLKNMKEDSSVCEASINKNTYLLETSHASDTAQSTTKFDFILEAENTTSSVGNSNSLLLENLENYHIGGQDEKYNQFASVSNISQYHDDIDVKDQVFTKIMALECEEEREDLQLNNTGIIDICDKPYDTSDIVFIDETEKHIEAAENTVNTTHELKAEVSVDNAKSKKEIFGTEIGEINDSMLHQEQSETSIAACTKEQDSIQDFKEFKVEIELEKEILNDNRPNENLIKAAFETSVETEKNNLLKGSILEHNVEEYRTEESLAETVVSQMSENSPTEMDKDNVKMTQPNDGTDKISEFGTKVEENSSTEFKKTTKAFFQEYNLKISELAKTVSSEDLSILKKIPETISTDFVHKDVLIEKVSPETSASESEKLDVLECSEDLKISTEPQEETFVTYTKESIPKELTNTSEKSVAESIQKTEEQLITKFSENLPISEETVGDIATIITSADEGILTECNEAVASLKNDEQDLSITKEIVSLSAEITYKSSLENMPNVAEVATSNLHQEHIKKSDAKTCHIDSEELKISVEPLKETSLVKTEESNLTQLIKIDENSAAEEQDLSIIKEVLPLFAKKSKESSSTTATESATEMATYLIHQESIAENKDETCLINSEELNTCKETTKLTTVNENEIDIGGSPQTIQEETVFSEFEFPSQEVTEEISQDTSKFEINENLQMRFEEMTDIFRAKKEEKLSLVSYEDEKTSKQTMEAKIDGKVNTEAQDIGHDCSIESNSKVQEQFISIMTDNIINFQVVPLDQASNNLDKDSKICENSIEPINENKDNLTPINYENNTPENSIENIELTCEYENNYADSESDNLKNCMIAREVDNISEEFVSDTIQEKIVTIKSEEAPLKTARKEQALDTLSATQIELLVTKNPQQEQFILLNLEDPDVSNNEHFCSTSDIKIETVEELGAENDNDLNIFSANSDNLEQNVDVREQYQEILEKSANQVQIDTDEEGILSNITKDKDSPVQDVAKELEVNELHNIVEVEINVHLSESSCCEISKEISNGQELDIIIPGGLSNDGLKRCEDHFKSVTVEKIEKANDKLDTEIEVVKEIFSNSIYFQDNEIFSGMADSSEVPQPTIKRNLSELKAEINTSENMKVVEISPEQETEFNHVPTKINVMKEDDMTDFTEKISNNQISASISVQEDEKIFLESKENISPSLLLQKESGETAQQEIFSEYKENIGRNSIPECSVQECHEKSLLNVANGKLNDSILEINTIKEQLNEDSFGKSQILDAEVDESILSEENQSMDNTDITKNSLPSHKILTESTGVTFSATHILDKNLEEQSMATDSINSITEQFNQLSCNEPKSIAADESNLMGKTEGKNVFGEKLAAKLEQNFCEDEIKEQISVEPPMKWKQFKIKNQSIDSIDNNSIDTEELSEVYWDSKDSDCVSECSKNHIHRGLKYMLSESVSEQESFETAFDDLEARSWEEISECEAISFCVENTNKNKTALDEEYGDIACSIKSKQPEKHAIIYAADEKNFSKEADKEVEIGYEESFDSPITSEKDIFHVELGKECKLTQNDDAELAKIAEIPFIADHEQAMVAQTNDKMNIVVESKIETFLKSVTRKTSFKSSVALKTEEIQEACCKLFEVPNELISIHPHQPVIQQDSIIQESEQLIEGLRSNSSNNEESITPSFEEAPEIALDLTKNQDESLKEQKKDIFDVKSQSKDNALKKNSSTYKEFELTEEKYEESCKFNRNMDDLTIKKEDLDEIQVTESFNTEKNYLGDEPEVKVIPSIEDTSSKKNKQDKASLAHTIVIEDLHERDCFNPKNVDEICQEINEIIDEHSIDEMIPIPDITGKAQFTEVLEDVDNKKKDFGSELLVVEQLSKEDFSHRDQQEHSILIDKLVKERIIDENCINKDENNYNNVQASILDPKVPFLKEETAILAIKKKVYSNESETELVEENFSDRNEKNKNANAIEEPSLKDILEKLPTSSEPAIFDTSQKIEDSIIKSNELYDLKIETDLQQSLQTEINNDILEINEENELNKLEGRNNVQFRTDLEQSLETPCNMLENSEIITAANFLENPDDKNEMMKNISNNDRDTDYEVTEITPAYYDVPLQPKDNITGLKDVTECNTEELTAPPISSSPKFETVENMAVLDQDQTEVDKSCLLNSNTETETESVITTCLFDNGLENLNVKDEQNKKDKTSEEENKTVDSSNAFSDEKSSSSKKMDDICVIHQEIDEDNQLKIEDDAELSKSNSQSSSNELETSVKSKISNLDHKTEEAKNQNSKFMESENDIPVLVSEVVSYEEILNFELPCSTFSTEENSNFLTEAVENPPLPYEPIKASFEQVHCIQTAQAHQELLNFSVLKETQSDILEPDENFEMELNTHRADDKSENLSIENLSVSNPDKTMANLVKVSVTYSDSALKTDSNELIENRNVPPECVKNEKTLKKENSTILDEDLQHIEPEEKSDSKKLNKNGKTATKQQEIELPTDVHLENLKKNEDQNQLETDQIKTSDDIIIHFETRKIKSELCGKKTDDKTSMSASENTDLKSVNEDITILDGEKAAVNSSETITDLPKSIECQDSASLTEKPSDEIYRTAPTAEKCKIFESPPTEDVENNIENISVLEKINRSETSSVNEVEIDDKTKQEINLMKNGIHRSNDFQTDQTKIETTESKNTLPTAQTTQLNNFEAEKRDFQIQVTETELILPEKTKPRNSQLDSDSNKTVTPVKTLQAIENELSDYISIKTNPLPSKQKQRELVKPTYSKEKSHTQNFEVVGCQEAPEIKFCVECEPENQFEKSNVNRNNTNVEITSSANTEYVPEKSESNECDSDLANEVDEGEQNLRNKIERNYEIDMKSSTIEEEILDFQSGLICEFSSNQEIPISIEPSSHYDIDKGEQYECSSVNILENKEIDETKCEQNRISSEKSTSETEFETATNKAIQSKRKSEERKERKKPKRDEEQVKISEGAKTVENDGPELINDSAEESTADSKLVKLDIKSEELAAKQGSTITLNEKENQTDETTSCENGSKKSALKIPKNNDIVDEVENESKFERKNGKNETITEKTATVDAKNIEEPKRLQLPVDKELSPLPGYEKLSPLSGQNTKDDSEIQQELKVPAAVDDKKLSNQTDDDKLNSLKLNTSSGSLVNADEVATKSKCKDEESNVNKHDGDETEKCTNVSNDSQTDAEKSVKLITETSTRNADKEGEPKSKSEQGKMTEEITKAPGSRKKSDQLDSGSVKDSQETKEPAIKKSSSLKKKSSNKETPAKRNSRKGSKGNTDALKAEDGKICSVHQETPEKMVTEHSLSQENVRSSLASQSVPVTENASSEPLSVDELSFPDKSLSASSNDVRHIDKSSEKDEYRKNNTKISELRRSSGSRGHSNVDAEIIASEQSEPRIANESSFSRVEHTTQTTTKHTVPSKKTEISVNWLPSADVQETFGSGKLQFRKPDTEKNRDIFSASKIRDNVLFDDDHENYLIKIAQKSLLTTYRPRRSVSPLKVAACTDEKLLTNYDSLLTHHDHFDYLRLSTNYSIAFRSPSRDVSPSRFTNFSEDNAALRTHKLHQSKYSHTNYVDHLRIFHRCKSQTPFDRWVVSTKSAGDLNVYDRSREFYNMKNDYSDNIPYYPVRFYSSEKRILERNFNISPHYRRSYRENEDSFKKYERIERYTNSSNLTNRMPLYRDHFHHGFNFRRNHHSHVYHDSGLIPRVKTLHADDKVPVGATVTLHMKVEGTPKPNIEWIKEGKTLWPIPSHYRYIDDVDVHTLVITNISYNEAGNYKCTAWNKFGYANASADIQVVATGGLKGGKPPMFISRPQTILTVNSDSDVSVSFRISGDPKPRVTWMKGLTDITVTQRTLKETINDYTRLTLKRAQLTDAGTYFIIAKNKYGSDRAFFTLRVNQRSRSLTPLPLPLHKIYTNYEERKSNIYTNKIPGAISSEPFVSEFGKNRLTLHWSKPTFCGGASISFYRVEGWLTGEDGGAKWIELGNTPTTSIDLYNLKPGKKYNFRVTPRNKYGWGESKTTSTPITVEDTPEFPEFDVCLPGELKALLGTVTELECKVKNDKDVEIQWFQDGALLEDNEYREFKYENGRCFLKLIDLQDTDSGRYICQASNSQGTICTFTRLLVVDDPKLVQTSHRLNRLRHENEGKIDMAPQFTMRLRNKRVEITHPIRLTCQVIGYPKPTITWQKDGQILKEGQNYSVYHEADDFHSLEINHAMTEDAGTYSAVASNPSGTVSCKCDLTVDRGIRSYEMPKFIEKLDKVYAIGEGSQLRIRAKVQAYPNVGVFWHKNGIRLRPSRRIIATLSHEGEVELTIAQIKQVDSGVYTCTATNIVGHAETNTRIDVHPREHNRESEIQDVESSDPKMPKEPRFLVKPRSCDAVEDDHVVIECKIVGDPKPQIIWLRDRLSLDYYRDSDEFKISTSNVDPFVYRLEIARVKFDHTGAYTIIAKNEAGEAKAIVSLQVYSKGPRTTTAMNSNKIKYSRVEKIPRIKRHLADVKCCDGDSVAFEFEIDVEGDSSEIDFHWYKNGKLIPLGEDFVSNVRGNVASFAIKQVYPEDEGQYSCIVTNNLGTASSTACLIVNVPEEKENIINRQMNRHAGTRSRSTTPLRSTHRQTTFPKENTEVKQNHLKRVAPKFVTIPHSRVAEMGDTVRFQCSVSGHPSPTTTWDKHSFPITSTDRVSVLEKDDLRILEISNVTVDDEGFYRVLVGNDYGHVVATVRLDVIKTAGFRNHQRSKTADQHCEKPTGPHFIDEVSNADSTCATSRIIPNGSTNSSLTGPN